MSEQTENKITYSTQMYSTRQADWRKTITHKKVDKYDFSKPFFEVLDNPEYVRLYFDFDDVKTIEEYEEVIDWLDQVYNIFGHMLLVDILKQKNSLNIDIN